jgi:penicillin-binding protein 1B
LFRQLPSQPLSTDVGDGIDFAWIDPQTGRGTQPECEGARRLPFISGYAPQDTQGCFWQQFRGMFGGNNPSPPAPSPPGTP